VQQIERDCFNVAKRRSIYIYTTLAFLALLGAPYIYDISSLRVKENQKHFVSVQRRALCMKTGVRFIVAGDINLPQQHSCAALSDM